MAAHFDRQCVRRGRLALITADTRLNLQDIITHDASECDVVDCALDDFYVAEMLVRDDDAAPALTVSGCALAPCSSRLGSPAASVCTRILSAVRTARRTRRGAVLDDHCRLNCIANESFTDSYCPDSERLERGRARLEHTVISDASSRSNGRARQASRRGSCR